MTQICEILPKLMADLGAIPKAHRNTTQSYNYRAAEDLLNQLHPVLVKHRVSLATSVQHFAVSRFSEERAKGSRTVYHASLILTVTLRAPDGSTVELMAAGEGVDYGGDKAANKAMSAAWKYALYLGLCVPYASLDDSDREPEQAAQPEPLATRTAGTSKPSDFPAVTISTPPKPVLTAPDCGPYSLGPTDPCSEAQRDAIKDMARKAGWDAHNLKAEIVEVHNVQMLAQLTHQQATQLLAKLQGLYLKVEADATF